MVQLREKRLQLIMELLREKGALTTIDLRQKLGVSPMTIHRDLNHLADKGLVERVHGGVLLATGNGVQPICAYCGKEINPRTPFIIHLRGGEAKQACCAHCGLQMLESISDAESALAADFLFGTMTNVKEGTFLIHSELSVCCSPSAFVFARKEDAHRMRAGFGGQVFDLEGALAVLRQEMQLHVHDR